MHFRSLEVLDKHGLADTWSRDAVLPLLLDFIDGKGLAESLDNYLEFVSTSEAGEEEEENEEWADGKVVDVDWEVVSAV